MKKLLIIIYFIFTTIFGTVSCTTDTKVHNVNEENTDHNADNQEDKRLLIDLPDKGLGEYTIEDCLLILNSSISDIGIAFDIDISLEPSGGMLLPDATIASPVMQIARGIFVICPLQKNMDNKVEINELPHKIYFYGEKGEPSILEEFYFGMQLNQELLNSSTNSFYKVFEAGDTYPAKKIERVDDNMLITLYFEFYEENYYLYCVCVSFPPN